MLMHLPKSYITLLYLDPWRNSSYSLSWILYLSSVILITQYYLDKYLILLEIDILM